MIVSSSSSSSSSSWKARFIGRRVGVLGSRDISAWLALSEMKMDPGAAARLGPDVGELASSSWSSSPSTIGGGVNCLHPGVGLGSSPLPPAWRLFLGVFCGVGGCHVPAALARRVWFAFAARSARVLTLYAAHEKAVMRIHFHLALERGLQLPERRCMRRTYSSR